MKYVLYTVLFDLEDTVWNARIDERRRQPDASKLEFPTSSFVLRYSPSVRKPPSGVYPVGSWMLAR